MRHIVIGTAGHIDHGKSTLVQALTGIDPDRLKEEKARGITIDLGFAHCQIGETRIAFVDVPGHERFVRNMLAGATGIDAVLLVVAADESVMPQTREHFAICKLLCVGAGVVALTKADAADPDSLAIARSDVRELIAGSFLDGAPIVDVSAKTGAGLDALRDALVQVAARARVRETDGPMRLPIDRAFSMKGFGTVVTGTLVSGMLRVEDEVQLLPAARRVRIRGLQVHGERVKEATSGQRVAANLDGIDTADITRGDLLATPDVYAPTQTADVTVDLLDDAKPLVHGSRVHIHHGTRDALARVSLLESRVEPGTHGYARLRLESPLVMTRGDRFVLRAYSPVVTIGGGTVLDPQPPRHALRSEAVRVRFHIFLAPGPNATPLDREPTLRAIELMMDERGREGLPIAALTGRLGLRDGDAELIARTLVGESSLPPSQRSHEDVGEVGAGAPTASAPAGAPASKGRGASTSGASTSGVRAAGASVGIAVRVGDVLVSREVLGRIGEAVLEQVLRHHQAQPDSEGIPREEVRDRVRVSGRVFERVVQDLVDAGKLVGRERLASSSHRVVVADADSEAAARLEGHVRGVGLKALDAGELAAALQMPAATVERLVMLAVRQKRLVKLGTLVFHPEVLARLREETRALKAGAPAGRAIVNVASFKTRYDVSRKYAIPLLEYLDRERVTRRVGDERVVL